MQRVPDVVVLDFCEWICNKLRRNEIEPISVLDAFLLEENRANKTLLRYAQEYIEFKGPPCKYFMQEFLNSEEVNRIYKYCYKRCINYHKWKFPFRDICGCLMYCPRLEKAFHDYCNRMESKESFSHKMINYDFNAVHLADTIRYYGNDFFYKYENNSTFNPLQFMISSSETMSVEIDFLEWLRKNNLIDLKKMPSNVYEKIVVEYIEETKKTTIEMNKLLKLYRKTGWEKVLNIIKELIKIDYNKKRTMSEVFNRYYNDSLFKCVILPLEDSESQQEYCYLIDQLWSSLNELSGDYLDIYYSEKDTGKSGYDIAKRISSLPEELKLTPPCIILWKNSMHDAKAISILDLDNKDMFELIKNIVYNIRANKKIDNIVEEANKKVEELKNAKRNITNISDVNGIININSPNSVFEKNVIKKDQKLNTKTIVKDFDTVIRCIQESDELTDEMKLQLIENMKEAKKGIEDNSEEQCNKARITFNSIKPFFATIAPKLLDTLAKIATIATFFGLAQK